MGPLLDPVAIVTGIAVGLILLDFRPGRIETALILLGAFVLIAWGVNFQIDAENGAYSWVGNYSNATDRYLSVTTHYLDDKPAKLRLEVSRAVGAAFWLCLIRLGIPALNRLRNP